MKCVQRSNVPQAGTIRGFKNKCMIGFKSFQFRFSTISAFNQHINQGKMVVQHFELKTFPVRNEEKNRKASKTEMKCVQRSNVPQAGTIQSFKTNA